jgi:hypothetical protein
MSPFHQKILNFAHSSKFDEANFLVVLFEQKPGNKEYDPLYEFVYELHNAVVSNLNSLSSIASRKAGKTYEKNPNSLCVLMQHLGVFLMTKEKDDFLTGVKISFGLNDDSGIALQMKLVVVSKGPSKDYSSNVAFLRQAPDAVKRKTEALSLV